MQAWSCIEHTLARTRPHSLPLPLPLMDSSPSPHALGCPCLLADTMMMKMSNRTVSTRSVAGPVSARAPIILRPVSVRAQSPEVRWRVLMRGGDVSSVMWRVGPPNLPEAMVIGAADQLHAMLS